MNLQDLEPLSDTELRQIADECERLIDVKNGNCPDCHGSGREHGDPEFGCGGCGGDGTLASYEAEEDDPHSDCDACGETHPDGVLEGGRGPACVDEDAPDES